MQTKHQGSLSELTACAWLLRQGYEVFRNVSTHGYVNVIAFDPKSRLTLMLDIKTRGKGQMTPPMATREQHRLGVKFLLVDRDTGVCDIVDPKPWKGVTTDVLAKVVGGIGASDATNQDCAKGL
jgi:hypothetical protein